MAAYEYAYVYRHVPAGASVPSKCSYRLPDGTEHDAPDGFGPAVLDVLNELGAHGWEIVGVERSTHQGLGQTTFWLKRECQ
jgi:hypothetical protein